MPKSFRAACMIILDILYITDWKPPGRPILSWAFKTLLFKMCIRDRPTALNSVIDKATQAGIKVIAFDSVVTNESAYKMDYDFVKFGTDCGAFIADKLGGTGNIVMVRGVSGTAPDENMFKGFEMVLGDHPDLNVVATVVGEASATVAQEEFTKILPSLDKVDATFNQGGDSYGIAQAFEQAGIEPPIIVGDNSAEFIQWWIEQKEKNGYDTVSYTHLDGYKRQGNWHVK